MNDQDDSSNFSSSLLRRFLQADHEPGVPDDDLPAPALRPAASDPDEERPPTSPIRPAATQDDSQPQNPLTPSPPQKQPPPPPLTPREQMQRAEEALIRLREKMAQIAAEFAQGKLNRAQFDAIYSRYSEQRLITERLLARNPESQAWQSVISPGHTTFLKTYFEARVVSYAIYDQATFDLIHLTGTLQLERAQLVAVLQRLQTVIRERGNPGPAHKKLSDGRCILFVPGDLTTAVVLFTLEPSAMQIARLQDIHRDFERANQHALQLHDYTAERLVFPHRALFEDNKY